ncbi:hypothetical protein [Croceicoccus bisphenolivorans]|uniref:hypothetical protein n=1 Tax=Croceicoccus bisphenolivorans TaxID=1783232 RepID=UPI000834454D|nr:hypothetical protein [Croceicoccus bisphenolivorans]
MLKPICALAKSLWFVAPFVVPATAHAWGERGHSAIDIAAIEALPEDGPVFLRDNLATIAGASTAPDKWRGSSEPFSKIAEDPNHTWFIERLRFLDPVPRSRYAFVLALYREHQAVAAEDPKAAERLNVRWTGTMPYAIAEGYGRIVSAMREYRRLRDAGQDTGRIEQTIAFYTAWMGHYVGDAANPMHVSIHCEGWVGPNPNGYATDGEVHGRFESQFVDAIGLTPENLSGRISAPSRQNGDLFDAVLDYIAESNSHVEAIFRFDKNGALHNRDEEAREYTYDRAAFGAGMLRDLLYRAWLESAAQGNGPHRPQDPDAPGYDPETGTAPA